MGVREDLLTRVASLATELAASRDGDSNEYVIRRWQELEYAINLIQKLDAVTEVDAGPFEVITQGDT
jgi:hypothetical protein